MERERIDRLIDALTEGIMKLDGLSRHAARSEAFRRLEQHDRETRRICPVCGSSIED